jgi:hypothetical protein
MPSRRAQTEGIQAGSGERIGGGPTIEPQQHQGWLPTAQVPVPAPSPATTQPASVARGRPSEPPPPYSATSRRSLLKTVGVAAAAAASGAALFDVQNARAAGTSSLNAGPLSSRPSAGNPGSFYLAIDVGPAPGTLYEDNGSVWLAIGGNAELGYAELTGGNFGTSSSSPVDVSGLTLSFVSGDRPFIVEATLPMLCYVPSGVPGPNSYALATLLESFNFGPFVAIQTAFAIGQPASQTQAAIPCMLTRRRSLTRGAQVGYKIQLQSGSDGRTCFVLGATFGYATLAARQV